MWVPHTTSPSCRRNRRRRIPTAVHVRQAALSLGPRATATIRLEDKARELFSKLDQTKTREDFVAAAQFLKHEPHGNGKLGVVGFCYGGGIAHLLATRLPDLDAAVPFYGMPPAPEEAKKVKAPLLVNLAEHDDRINSAWPAYETALKAAGVKYEAFSYPGTQHGFHNDTTPRYDEASAKLAWQRTLALFHRTLDKPKGKG